MKYLGIDLGGTNVAAAVVDAEGSILGRASLPTPRGAERSPGGKNAAGPPIWRAGRFARRTGVYPRGRPRGETG